MAFAQRVELAFQTTSIDHATALGESTEQLVERLELAAGVHGDAAEELRRRLHDDVEAAGDHLRDTAQQASEAVRDAVARAASEAVTELTADVVAATRAVIAQAAVDAAAEVGGRTDDLTTELRTAVTQSQQRMGESLESAVARLERVADTVADGGTTATDVITATAAGHATVLQTAVDEVRERLLQVGSAAADVDARLGAAAQRVEAGTDTAATRLERVGEAALTRVIADVGELVGRLQDSTTRAQEHVGRAAEQAGAQMADAAEDLARTATTATTELTARGEAISVAAAAVAEAGQATTAAADRLEAVTERFVGHTDASIARTTEVADTMAGRFAEVMDAAITAGQAQTAGDIETLTTTVAWAGRTVQGLIERLIDDVTATATTAVQRVDAAGDAAHARIVDLVEDLEGRLLEEVGRALGPVVTETARVAEQQAALAETAARVERLMGRREAEADRREDVLARIERQVAVAADMVGEGTAQLRAEQEGAVRSAGQAAAALAGGGEAATALLIELDRIAERLEVATAAADRSRQGLEALVVRAAELAADAAARRRRAPMVPPPEGR